MDYHWFTTVFSGGPLVQFYFGPGDNYTACRRFNNARQCSPFRNREKFRPQTALKQVLPPPGMAEILFNNQPLKNFI